MSDEEYMTYLTIMVVFTVGTIIVVSLALAELMCGCF